MINKRLPTLAYSLAVIVVFLLLSVLPLIMAASTVTPGYDPSAVLKGGVRYRAFNQLSQREIFLGKPDLGVGGNRVELDCVWLSPGSNHINFGYNPIAGTLTTVVTASAVYTLTYASGNIGALNYMQIIVASRQGGATVGFHNVMLDSISLGDFDPPGVLLSNWMITNYDFSNGFVIEGDLVLTGTQPTGAETNKLEIDVGYLAQYYLTVKTDPLGVTAISGEGWYTPPATVTLTAPAIAGSYRFWGWDVDGVPQGTTNPINVAMSAPHTATAHYSDSAVGGEWAPINTVQLVSPWIALALIAMALAAAGSHRLLKKRL